MTMVNSDLKGLKPVSLPNQITGIGSEMCGYASIFANVWSQLKQNMSDFHLLELVGRAVPIHKFQWLQIKITLRE